MAEPQRALQHLGAKEKPPGSLPGVLVSGAAGFDTGSLRGTPCPASTLHVGVWCWAIAASHPSFTCVSIHAARQSQPPDAYAARRTSSALPANQSSSRS